MSMPGESYSPSSKEEQWPVNPFLNPQALYQYGQNQLQYAWGQEFNSAGMPLPSGLPSSMPGVPGSTLPGGTFSRF